MLLGYIMRLYYKARYKKNIKYYNYVDVCQNCFFGGSGFSLYTPSIYMCVYFTSNSWFLTFLVSFFYLSFFISSSLWNSKQSIYTVPSPITVQTLFLANTFFRRNAFLIQIICLFHGVGYNNKYLSLLHFYLSKVWR